jgi:hypothetical protein
MTTKVTGSVLANTAVTAGTYGGASAIPVVTVDAQGRLTSAANATPSIANSQITGVMTASQLAATAVTTGTYGGSTQHSVVTVDQQGRVTFAANATPSIANNQITGVMTASQLAATAVTPATYGGAAAIPVITVDQQGRLTSAANVSVTQTAVYGNTNQITANTATGTVALGLASTAVTPGTYGGATQHSVVTVDQQGRVTFAANATPSIANNQITGVMTASQLAATAVTTGTYGGAATAAVITVDQQGRITAAANAAISAGGFSNMVVLTSTNASYSIPATKIKVTVVGGGGGGGGGTTNSSTGPGSGGGGGGSAVQIFSGLTVASTLNITIGAAGAGGAAGTPGTAGGSGGTTSVASGTQTITTVSATGGGAGGVQTTVGCTTTNAVAISGGLGSGGILNLRGGGSDAVYAQYQVSRGGNSLFGQGNGGSNAYGAGGSGSSGAGTAGTAGIVVIEY